MKHTAIKALSMLKGELVTTVADKMDGFLKKDIDQAVDVILETITEALANGHRVEIRGFGSFSVRSRRARVTKNPRTGKIMDIPPRKNLHFAMSKSLKDPLVKKG